MVCNVFDKIILFVCFIFSFFTIPLRPLKIKNALNLIIDIGNTMAKVALFNDGEMVEVLTESNQSLDCLKALCAKYPVNQGIVATVIDLNERVLADLAALPFPLLWLNHETPLPVVNLYETPETLGYDRMAAVVGANEQFPHRNILVIDAGTCITYEFIDSKGQYHGGNISPGMQMRFKALRQFTGRLPLVDTNGRKLPMGRDTETAIRAGVLNQGFGNSKAMGGIAFGLRDGAQINPLNPASYTAIDSLTFIFEGGVSLQNMNVNNGGVKLNAKNSSFDYLAMQFRLHPRIAMSVGLLPFSSVGYNVSESHSGTAETDGANNATPDYTKTLAGDGGLHQLYAGVGVKVLKNLSLGVNVSYFWGDITRSLTMLYPNTSSSYSFVRQNAVSVSDYKLDFGAQYTQDFGKKHSVTIGAVYSPKHNLNNDVTVTTQASTTVSNELDATLGLPNSFGVGVTYNYNRQLTVGVDYSLQKWADVNYKGDDVDNDMHETYTYCDRHKISMGAEYIPNLIGRSYLAHIKYRLGAYYTTPYYKVNGEKASREYGVTAGFGLPVPRSRSILSISGQFVRVKGLETNMVNENIFRVSIGLTFNERWFFKRRVE